MSDAKLGLAGIAQARRWFTGWESEAEPEVKPPLTGALASCPAFLFHGGIRSRAATPPSVTP